MANDRASVAAAFAAGSAGRNYVALFKPGITASAMMTAAWGVFESGAAPDAGHVAGAVAGVGLMVAAAGALNMVFEADTDRRMPRTCARPVAAGAMSRRDGTVAAAAAAFAGFAVLHATGGWIAPWLGVASLFIYAFIYTPLKRVSPAALVIGAVPGAAPPLIAATAVSAEVSAAALGLFALLFLWQIPHFGGITIRRRAEYRMAGLRLAPPESRLAQAAVGIRAASILLLVVPVPLAYACSWSPWIALGMMGAAMPMVRAAFARMHDPTGWGRNVFLGSLPYLPVVAVVIVLGAVLV